MRSFRRNDRGLSEIVGTLMLVLIVVTAATLLAAFVATYQKQLQTEQGYSHDQSLESIHILSLSTTLNKNGTGFATFGFTLASGYINPSIIQGISLNNEPLLHFNWTNPDNSTSGTITAGQDLTIPPFEEVQIATDLNPGKDYSFVNAPVPNQYLKFDVYTVLQNDFSRVFLPPVPLEVISEVNLTGTNSILLDGSSSFQPQGNASLVQWEWTVSNLSKVSPAQHIGPLFGEEAEFADNLTANANYTVSLTVTNSDGLIGTTSLTYDAL